MKLTLPAITPSQLPLTATLPVEPAENVALLVVSVMARLSTEVVVE